MNKKCQLSVILVSDYEPNNLKTWKDETALIQALAEQDIEEPFEVLLIESERNHDQIVPKSFYDLVPDLKVYYCDSLKSATLKDYGVSLSKGKYVAVLESDCIPNKNWLRLLLAAVVDKGWDISSGRTYYGEETTYQRIANLLHRSWYDPGSSVETTYISNNGAVYKREILENFQYPDSVTPFISAEIRNRKIQQQGGYRCYFKRSAVMKHALGGWSFVWDLQRNKGHQQMSSNHQQTLSAVPRLLFSKLRGNMRNARKHGLNYLRWYDWPLLLFFMLAELIPFSVGMVDAINNVQRVPGSAYR